MLLTHAKSSALNTAAETRSTVPASLLRARDREGRCGHRAFVPPALLRPNQAINKNESYHFLENNNKTDERKLVWVNQEAIYNDRKKQGAFAVRFFLFFLVLCPELSACTMRYNEERTGHSGIKEEWVVTEVTAPGGCFRS